MGNLSGEGRLEAWDQTIQLFRGDISSFQKNINLLALTLGKVEIEGHNFTQLKEDAELKLTRIIEATREEIKDDVSPEIKDMVERALVRSDSKKGIPESRKKTARSYTWCLGKVSQFDPTMLESAKIARRFYLSREEALSWLSEKIASLSEKMADGGFSVRTNHLIISSYLAIIRAILRKDMGVVFRNKDVRYSRKLEKRDALIIPSKQIGKILKTSIQEVSDPLMLLYVKVVLTTGQRRSDVLRLNVSNLSKRGNKQIVMRASKNNRALRFNISDSLHGEIMSVVKEDGSIFSDTANWSSRLKDLFREIYPEGSEAEPLNVLDSHGRVSTISESINDTLTTNTLRKSIISSLFEKGATLAEISKWCGDSVEVLSNNYVFNSQVNLISVEEVM